MNSELELLTQIELGEISINEISSTDKIMVGIAFQKSDFLPMNETQSQLLTKLSEAQIKAVNAFLQRPILLMNRILAHDITKPFTAELLDGLSFESGKSFPFCDDWFKNATGDPSVTNLKRQYKNVSDYLCCQVHMLNQLHLHYGFRGKYRYPYLQVHSSSVIEKIQGNPYSKHEHTPFKSTVLNGFEHEHIELFPFSSKYGRGQIYKGAEFQRLEAEKVEDATVRVKSYKNPLEKLISAEIEAKNIAHELLHETELNVRRKKPTDKGKVTGPWLISELAENNERKYLCITPHGNSMYPDTTIKAIIDIAKDFKL